MDDKELLKSSYILDLFTKEQIEDIVKSLFSIEADWKLLKSEVKAAASDGIIGYTGEYLRATLHIRVSGCIEFVHVFVKKIPSANQGKYKFIQEFSLFERESAVLNFFKKLGETDESKPWHAKTYICNENLIVMPDLALDGYKNTNHEESYDLEHMLVAVASLARFHAATANYETKKLVNTKQPNSILKEYCDVLKEVMFIESPWLDTVAKLTINILKEFSQKFKGKISQLEEKLIKLYVQARESLKKTENSLNVLLHRDLWTNNIMFKYDKGRPVNALFVDFQLVRYGPPAFDLMLLLYMNSIRCFRQEYEKRIVEYYFYTFLKSIDSSTKERVEYLRYDFVHFEKWCHKSRMFALLQAVALLPYAVMAPEAVRKTLNNPDKFFEYLRGDRSEPVIDHAKKSNNYKNRLLEVAEEFVERFACC